jgi:hypothetical protein
MRSSLTHGWIQIVPIHKTCNRSRIFSLIWLKCQRSHNYRKIIQEWKNSEFYFRFCFVLNLTVSWQPGVDIQRTIKNSCELLLLKTVAGTSLLIRLVSWPLYSGSLIIYYSIVSEDQKFYFCNVYADDFCSCYRLQHWFGLFYSRFCFFVLIIFLVICRFNLFCLRRHNFWVVYNVIVNHNLFSHRV